MNKILIIFQLVIFTAQYPSQSLPKIQNVVVIIADDHAHHVTGAYGNKIVRTPSIDKLANEGISFRNAYCNAPICSASRQSLLTGKYPHATGVNLLFTPFPDEGNITIAEHLQDAGYNTALIGKSHFNNWMWYDVYDGGLPKHGFDTLIQNEDYRDFYSKIKKKQFPEDFEFYSRPNSKDSIAEWMNWRALPQPVYDAESRGTFFANEAINFIKQNKKNKFFLWLAFNEPHHPYYFPFEYFGKYDSAEMPLPEGSPEDDRWIPEKYKDLTDKEKRGIISAYYTSTEYMDKNIGLVTDAIEANGLGEETLVIYISDNGYLLNDHRRFEKHTMWKEAIKQPTIFKIGNNFRKDQNENAIVEYVDIVPTILDLIGIEEINEVQGNSFLPLLTGEENNHKEFAFAEYLEDNLAMVASIEWKYVFTTGSRDLGIGYKTGYGPSGITHRLYNLENDPGETIDVSKNPQNHDLLQSMKEKMLQKFIATHPESKNLPLNLTLDGKLAWFCEPRDIGSDQSLREFPARVFNIK